MLSVLRHACGLLGAMLYRWKFRQTSMRKPFVITTLIITLFHGMQLILVTGTNEQLGISPKMFVLSSEAADAVIESFSL